MQENFLVQLAKEPTREGTLLKLMFMTTEALVGNVTTGGHLEHGGDEIKEFSVAREVKMGLRETAALDIEQGDIASF